MTHEGTIESGHYIAFVRARDTQAELRHMRDLAAELVGSAAHDAGAPSRRPDLQSSAKRSRFASESEDTAPDRSAESLSEDVEMTAIAVVSEVNALLLRHKHAPDRASTDATRATDGHDASATTGHADVDGSATPSMPALASSALAEPPQPATDLSSTMSVSASSTRQGQRHWRPTYSWFRVDDDKVSSVPPHVVESQQAYLLFYARRDVLRASDELDLVEMRRMAGLR